MAARNCHKSHCLLLARTDQSSEMFPPLLCHVDDFILSQCWRPCNGVHDFTDFALQGVTDVNDGFLLVAASTLTGVWAS